MSNLTPDEIEAMAAQAGLDKLTETHLQQLQRVTNDKQAQPATLPVAELTPADEPANVFVVSSARDQGKSP